MQEKLENIVFVKFLINVTFDQPGGEKQSLPFEC